jgi:hypothetical protein
MAHDHRAGVVDPGEGANSRESFDGAAVLMVLVVNAGRVAAEIGEAADRLRCGVVGGERIACHRPCGGGGGLQLFNETEGGAVVDKDGAGGREFRRGQGC